MENKIKKMYNSLLAAAVLVMISGYVCSVSAQTTAPAQSADLNSAVVKIRDDIARAEKEASRADALLRQYEHDVVYTNKQVARLYAEIKRLEKEMVTKRQALNEMLNSTPEAHEKNKAYLAAYGKLDALRREEQILLKKIDGAEVKAGGKAK